MVNNQQKKEDREKLEVKTELIKNRYPDIFEIMGDPATSSTIEKIAFKYKLEEPGEFKKKLEANESFTDIIQKLPSSKIAKILGKVFLGDIHPKTLSEILQKELKIKPELAEDIIEEIDRRIFSQIRISLNKLYKIQEEAPLKITPPEKPSPKESLKPDIYREPIE